MDADNIRLTLRTRLLETIKEVQGPSEKWVIMVFDEWTVKVASSACKMSDLTDAGISLVESIHKKREPNPTMPALYFLQPNQHNISKLIEDFANEKKPMYQSAHVYFSSKLSDDQLDGIKQASKLIARLEHLKEVFAEVQAEDSRGFSTGQPLALRTFFRGDYTPSHPPPSHPNTTDAGWSELECVASRLASSLALVGELPCVRYSSPREEEAATYTAAERTRLSPSASRMSEPVRSLGHSHQPGEDLFARLAQEVATRVHSHMTSLQRRIGLPENETCDLLIVDRSFDIITPVIHTWTYEAMVYDLLDIKNDVFTYTSETKGGETQTKSFLLGDKDPLWNELRHLHISEAMDRVVKKFDHFKGRYSSHGTSNGSNGAGDLLKVAESHPQYTEEMQKLSLHLEISSQLKARMLKEAGMLEEDIVSGDAASKDIINKFSEDLKWTPEDKLRVLLCYMAMHPEKLDMAERGKWSKLASLSPQQIHVLNNLEHVGVVAGKKDTGLKKWIKKIKPRGAPREQGGGPELGDLNRFHPHIQDLILDLANNSLSEEEFPYVRRPAGGAPAPSQGIGRHHPVTSARTKKSQLIPPQDTMPITMGDLRVERKRLVVFVIGGMTRSELRSAHVAANTTGRNVIIGSTSLDTPTQFLDHLSHLSPSDFEMQ